MTAESARHVGEGKFDAAKLFGSPEVDRYRQAIAVVVAERFGQARRQPRCSGSMRALGRQYDLGEALRTSPLAKDPEQSRKAGSSRKSYPHLNKPSLRPR